LHVDDDPEFADLTATFLEREDDRFDVVTATSAGEGLERLGPDVDCVVSDYEMPGRSGIEFLEAVRESHPDLPFILYTGKGSEAVAGEAIRGGATDYLQKDPGTDQYTVLANRIANAVEQYRARRRAAAQERINTVVREVNEALVRATTHEEIRERVPAILCDADPYRAAWIGDAGTGPDRIEPLATAGAAREYLDEVTVTVDHGSTGRSPVETAVGERTVAVSQHLSGDATTGSWRERAVEHGFRAVAAVPLEYEETLYGILAVYAAQPDAFDADEQALLAQLGETVGHAHHRVSVQERYEDQYRDLFEQAPVMFTFTRAEEGGPIIEDCNRQFAEKLGYERDELRGRPLADVYTEESRRALLDEEGYERALSGEFVREERTFRTRDGTELTTLLRATPRRDQSGELVGTHALFVDVADDPRALELELTRDRMEFALETTDSIIFELDLDTGRETRHGPFERLFGVAPSEVPTAEAFYERCIHPEDREEVETLQQPGTLSDGPGRVSCEFRTHPDHGEVRWIRWEAYVDTDADGEPRRLVGLDIDVTDRKRREQELERYRTVVEASGDPLFTLDADGTITFVNEAFRELTGYGRGELVGEDPSVFTTEAAIERGRAVIRELLSSSADRETFEIDVVTADGERIPCENHVALLPFEETFQGTVAVLRDVTDQKEREQELKRYANIVEASGDPVYTLDEDGRFTFVNEALLRMTGYEREDLVGNHFSQLLVRTDKERGAMVMRSLRGAETTRRTTELTIRHRDGTRIPCEINVTPLQYEEQFRGIVGVMRDVTARKRQQRELERQNERLEEFARVVSHDLRNPLTVLDGSLELARETGGAEHFERCEHAVVRMSQLIDDLLTLAREGEAVEDVESVPLREVSEECWATVATAGATLSVDTDRAVSADRSRLKQLFENLFRNAIQHGGDGVTVTVGDVDGGFYVADDGPGIPAGDRESVFEVGYSSTEDGTGFGLNIVERVAAAHGWSVRATESAEGGARFEVTDDN
jgi:PAS domain S-box-containing protein